MEYSTRIKSLLADSRLTDAHRRIITVLTQISDTMPYAELAKRSDYKKSTAQKLVSEASLIVADHGLRINRRSRGREVWVGIEEFPPPTRRTAYSHELDNNSTARPTRREKESLDYGNEKTSPKRETRPAPSFANEVMRWMLDLYMMQFTLRNHSNLLNLQKPTVSTQTTGSSLDDIIKFRILMKMF